MQTRIWYSAISDNGIELQLLLDMKATPGVNEYADR